MLTRPRHVTRLVVLLQDKAESCDTENLVTSDASRNKTKEASPLSFSRLSSLHIVLSPS